MLILDEPLIHNPQDTIYATPNKKTNNHWRVPSICQSSPLESQEQHEDYREPEDSSDPVEREGTVHEAALHDM
jgi:hypothetical protein